MNKQLCLAWLLAGNLLAVWTPAEERRFAHELWRQMHDAEQKAGCDAEQYQVYRMKILLSEAYRMAKNEDKKRVIKAIAERVEKGIVEPALVSQLVIFSEHESDLNEPARIQSERKENMGQIIALLNARGALFLEQKQP